MIPKDSPDQEDYEAHPTKLSIRVTRPDGRREVALVSLERLDEVMSRAAAAFGSSD
jgi:hypothetical protein